MGKRSMAKTPKILLYPSLDFVLEEQGLDHRHVRKLRWETS
jgi:hypothetical protein